jgi:hypothetical protein
MPVDAPRHPKPFWAIECLDMEEALALLDKAPEHSHIEQDGPLVILWVPVPADVIAAQLGL